MIGKLAVACRLNTVKRYARAERAEPDVPVITLLVEISELGYPGSAKC
jgi:hypothetical protein